MKKKSDRKIKTEATQSEFRRVFKKMCGGCDIYAECSDGRYIRRYWRNPNGVFGWDKWEKVEDFY